MSETKQDTRLLNKNTKQDFYTVFQVLNEGSHESQELKHIRHFVIALWKEKLQVEFP